MPASLFKMKSGGSSTMLPLPTGCERREVRWWLVNALGHLELAVQTKSWSRPCCEAGAKGRNGTAIAQPASTEIPAAAAVNLKVLQFTDASCRECSMSSPPPLPRFAL